MFSGANSSGSSVEKEEEESEMEEEEEEEKVRLIFRIPFRKFLSGNWLASVYIY